MKWWTVVRVAGPGSIGLALVVCRPSWVSVATLCLLLVVAMWFDGQERRADDVEALEEEFREAHTKLAERLGEAVNKAQATADSARTETTTAINVWQAHEMRLKEHSARLDIIAQQRKGPSL